MYAMQSPLSTPIFSPADIGKFLPGAIQSYIEDIQSRCEFFTGLAWAEIGKG